MHGECHADPSDPMKRPQTGGSPWLPLGGGSADAAHRVYCLAHAGGSAAFFHAWRQKPSAIDWVGVELPGRGARYGEPLVDDPQSLISRLSDALEEEFDKGSFALFGHSLGGLLAFHLACALQGRSGPQPVALFISAAAADNCNRPRLRDLPTAQFLAAIDRLNGTPYEVMSHPELVELFLPVLRADVTVAELLREQVKTVIQAPIIAFSGSDDTTTPASAMHAWQRYTLSDFSQVVLAGDHFYIRQQGETLREMIEQRLCKTGSPADFR